MKKCIRTALIVLNIFFIWFLTSFLISGCGRYSTDGIQPDVIEKASSVSESEESFVKGCRHIGKVTLYDNEVNAWNIKPKLFSLLAKAADRGATHVVYTKNSINGVSGDCYNCSAQKVAATPAPKRESHDSKEVVREHVASSGNSKGRYNSWAVIVGISKYQYSGSGGLTDLIYADDDAKAFARALKNLGWSESHITLLINEQATRRDIMIALESWLTKARPEDQIILFWAGHGYPDPENPEKVYFATYDTDISIPATGYRMDQVRRALEEKNTKNVVLLADTCHAGKLITRSNGKQGISILPDVRGKSVPKGWIFMVGADTDRLAIEGSSWSNGAFTHSLIKGLQGAADGFQSVGAQDGLVTMGELRAYMNYSMPEETQKVLGVAIHPVVTTSTGDPEIWNLTLNAVQ